MINETLDNYMRKHDRDGQEFSRLIRRGAPADALEQRRMALLDSDMSIAMEQYGDQLMEAGMPRKAGDAYQAAQSLAGGSADLTRWKGLQAKIIAAGDADWKRIIKTLGYEPAEDQDLPAFLHNRDWGFDPWGPIS
jgi:hypothetical protein